MENQRQLLIVDLDETIAHCVIHPSEVSKQNANLNLPEMAIFFRPNLLEFLKAFITKEIDMELGLFTKATKDYAVDILKQMKVDFSKKYPELTQQFDSIFQIKLYRKDLNSDHKDLNLIATQNNVDINNILLVDDLITNFTHQPQNCIRINEYKQIKRKENELLKLMTYLKTFNKKKTLVEQNVFCYYPMSLY